MNAFSPDFEVDRRADAAPEQLMIMKPAHWNGGARLAKTISAGPDGTFSSSKGGHPTLWTREAKSFSSIEDLLEVLEDADLRGCNFSYGLPTEGFDGSKAEPIVRSSSRVVTAANTTILLSDIENTPPMGNVKSLLEPTPGEVWLHLCDTDCVQNFQKDADVLLHYSGSHGASGSLSPRTHAFQLLDRAISLEWLKVLAGELEALDVVDPVTGAIGKVGTIDTDVLQKDRALWGSPIIGRGLKADPFPKRWHLVRGARRRIEVPGIDELHRLARAQEVRKSRLGIKARGAAADDVADRPWQSGGDWRTIFDRLRETRCHPLWPQLQSNCGSYIRQVGMDDEDRATWIGEVRNFLLTEGVTFDRSSDRVERVKKVAKDLPTLWAAIAEEHDWQVNPRAERRIFPAPTMPLEAARETLGRHLDNIFDDGVSKMGAADRVALAIAMVRDARAKADELDEKARAAIAEAAAAEAAAGEARKRRATPVAEAQLTHASGLRRRAAAGFKLAADLRQRATKFGRRTKVLVPCAEPGPDGEMEVFIDPPARASGVWPIAPSVGVGKTESIVERIERLVASGARVLVASGTQVLSESFEARLRARYPGGELPFTLATYRGEGQPDRINPGRTMCPRAEDRAELRRNGLEASKLCGSEQRGLCSFKPRKKPAADAPPPCQWLLQQDELADADVVTMNAGPMLSAETPAFMRRREKAFTRYDWIRRRPRTILIARPDFDLVVLDEPSFERLEEIETETAADDAEPEVCAHKLEGIRRADILQGPRPEIREGWRQGRGPDEQDVEGGHKELAEILADLAEATDALCAAAERHGAVYGYLTYGELHAALGNIPDYQRRDRAHELANKAFAAIQEAKSLGGGSLKAWMDDGGRLYAAWNRRMIFLHRLWMSVASALDRSRNAEDNRPNAYVKRIDLPAGRGRPHAPALAARKVEKLHKSLRAAPIIILDASYREELAAPHLNAIANPACRLIVPPAPGSCHVTVASDSSFSYARITKAIAAWEKGDGPRDGELVGQIARWAARGAFGVRGLGEIVVDAERRIDALLVVPMALEKALTAYWEKHGGKPENLDATHFGALRGLDCWRNVMWCGVVSRMLAPLHVSIDRANLLSGEVDQSPAREFIRSVGEYDSHEAEWRWTLKGSHPRLPNPIAEACRAATCDDELAQALGRLRLAQRPGAGIAVEVLTNHPIERLPVDRFVAWRDLLGGGDPYADAAAAGVVYPAGKRGSRARIAQALGVSENTVRKRGLKTKTAKGENS